MQKCLTFKEKFAFQTPKRLPLCNISHSFYCKFWKIEIFRWWRARSNWVRSRSIAPSSVVSNSIGILALMAFGKYMDWWADLKRQPQIRRCLFRWPVTPPLVRFKPNSIRFRDRLYLLRRNAVVITSLLNTLHSWPITAFSDHSLLIVVVFETSLNNFLFIQIKNSRDALAVFTKLYSDVQKTELWLAVISSRSAWLIARHVPSFLVIGGSDNGQWLTVCIHWSTNSNKRLLQAPLPNC